MTSQRIRFGKTWHRSEIGASAAIVTTNSIGTVFGRVPHNNDPSPSKRGDLNVRLRGCSRWVHATLSLNPPCIENKSQNRSLGLDQQELRPGRVFGPDSCPAEGSPNQYTGSYCIDRLSWHDLSGVGPNPGDNPLSASSVDGTYGFAVGCCGGGSGFGIRNVHEKPNTMVRPCGRARAWYSS
jgi:hypothetical protein